MIEIADRIFYIEAENRGRYPFCHSLYVNDNTSVIIDPACRGDLMQEIATRSQVDIVLNSHYHEDHRIYNYCFNGARLSVHHLDVRGYGPVDDFMNDFSVVYSPTHRAIWREFLLDTCKYRPYAVDKTITDGIEIDLGHTLLKVLHTPGHSAGHCCFLFPREGILYLGDIDLTSFGPWYASNNSSIDEFLASIDYARKMRPRTVITSHGDGFVKENVDERLKEYAGIIHRRDNLLLDFLSHPHSLDEIFSLEVVYRHDQKTPAAFFYWDDRMMIEMHLARLVRLGKLKKGVDKTYSIA